MPTSVLTRRNAPVFWLAIYLTLQVVAGFLSLPAGAPVWLMDSVLLASAALFMFISLAVCASLTNVVRRPAPAATMLGVGAAGWALAAILGPLPPNPPDISGPGPAALLLHLADELFRIIATVGIGILMAAAIRERNILLPAAVFAAFADYFMVNFGTVHLALKTTAGQHLVHAMSAKVPMMRGMPVLTVGPADFVFMAFFFACVFRFDLYFKRTFAALFLLLTFSLFFVVRVGPIPALAPMALGFVLVNFRRFKLAPQEIQAMVAAGAIVVIIAIGIIFYGKR